MRVFWEFAPPLSPPAPPPNPHRRARLRNESLKSLTGRCGLCYALRLYVGASSCSRRVRSLARAAFTRVATRWSPSAAGATACAWLMRHGGRLAGWLALPAPFPRMRPNPTLPLLLVAFSGPIHALCPFHRGRMAMRASNYLGRSVTRRARDAAWEPQGPAATNTSDPLVRMNNVCSLLHLRHAVAAPG